MTGTVAVGSAVVGANVTVIDSKGVSAAAVSDSSGNYSIDITTLTPPLAIVASDPSGISPTLVSVLAGVPAGSATITANVTTLTTAVAALLTSSGNSLDVASPANLSSLVTQANVASAVTKLDTALQSILAMNGLNASSFDPIGTPFKANQTGADAAIDAVQIVAAPTGGTKLMSASDPINGFALNVNSSPLAPLVAPPAAANYLSAVVTALGQCLGGNSASCSQAIDSSYLENGYSTFAAAHPALAASGVTLGTPQTLKFFMSNGTQKALVLLRYKAADGTLGSTTTIVQQSGGTWDIVGNQQPYNVTISSFLARRQSLDATNQPYSRYEAGLGINIPVGAAGTPNPVNLASASVTGPGISGSVYLVPRNGTGNTLLALTSTALQQAPTAPMTTNSNTSLYRWSWQTLPGLTGTFAPGSNNSGLYTPQPIDTTNVPQYANYTVTFYDATGTAIGQPFTVTNVSPTLPAAAGNGVAWQSLLSSTTSAFLSPSGSAASAQGAVNLQWANNTTTANIAPLVMKAQIQASPGTGVTPATEVDGWWVGPATYAPSGQYSATVTAGMDQTGTQQCTPACAFPALQAGASRLVQLGWTSGQVSFYNIWKYND
ncbi:hypothetical protein D7S89_07090 [Trinickia fusca]|uniref:Cell wall anchor protein n=2 Tax=Trinickia fusca TaxID=2419777 RepID=A0A494XM55_9BURK|nr:hypothetical protein D7S89_07090 [Trinickia fusca]